MERSQIRTFNRNGRSNNRRAYPELVVSHAGDRDATYHAALKLVERIDEDLTKGIRHYRNTAGELLTTLDQVINAILTDDLLLPEAQEAEVMWIPQELAA